MTETDKVRENRARRAAARQGFRLERCKLRDPRATGYSTYRLVDDTGSVVAAGPEGTGGFGLDLEGVEAFLNRHGTWK